MGFSDWFGEGDANDWLGLALQLYGAHQASKPGQFVQVPQSPEQKAANQRVLGFIDNSPTRNMLGGMLSQRLNQNEDYHLPTYGQANYQPFSGHTKNYDLSKIFGSAGPPPPTDTTPPGPTGTAGGGDPFGHATAPGGSPGDPFANWPAPGSGGPGGGGLDAISQWISDHPGIAKLGVSVLAGAIGSAFGIPFALAAGIANKFLGKGKPPPDDILPIRHNDVSAGNLAPAGGRTAVPDPTYQQQSGAQFIGSQEYNLASGHNQLAPDRLGGNRDLFGGGGYNGFYHEAPWGKRVPMPGKPV